MRRLPMPLSLASVLAMALAVAACDKAGAKPAATPAASSSEPVQWDYTSKDPARNPNEANKEAVVPGYNP